jgi:antitoxin component YwqK of YwqJK toxin-antitoxin module
MGMLDRIKKRQINGFKDFVISMETSSGQKRGQIFMAGVLEDPIFMSYVMKNIKSFDDFLKLDSEEIDAVLSSQEQILTLFAKYLHGSPQEILTSFETTIPRLISRLKDELSYLSQVTTSEKEGAKFYIMKVTRQLQMEEKIHGFSWRLPPQDVYYQKQLKDGQSTISFENGVVAAEGLLIKGRRMGEWKHFYENGKLLAQGDYFDSLKAGEWSFYYSNGDLKSRGKYKADEKHGLWREYDRNGTLSEVEYVEGFRKD